MQTISYTDSKIFRISIFLAFFTFSITILVVGKSFLIPLAWSILIALASIRMLDRLERKIKINRLIASLLFVGLVLLVMVFLFFFFFIELRSIISGIPSFADKLNVVLQSNLHTLKAYGIPIPEDINRGNIHEWIHGHAELVTKWLASFGRGFVNLFLITVYLFFLIYFRDNYIYYLRLREKTEAGFNTALKKYNEVMAVINNFIFGYFIMTLTLAVMLCVIFMLIGLKYALFFSILVALLTLIPYIGNPVGTLIVFIFASISYDSLTIPLLAVAGIFISNFLKSNILKPIIIGKKINLNAFIVFLSVIVGGMMWGVSGMILFMPLVGIINVLIKYSEKSKPLVALFSTVPKGALDQKNESGKVIPEEVKTSENN